jgi:hypothetical protein
MRKYIYLFYVKFLSGLLIFLSIINVFKRIEVRILIPFVSVILLLAIILAIISSSTVLAPFIYPLF